MKINKGLVSLAFGAFAIGMTEFTMMGILPDIAKDLQIDIPTAGHLIALYALGVVIGVPVLVAFATKYPPKKVLLALMGVFVLFNACFAIAPNNSLLYISRFLSGLPHGAFFGVGGVAAVRLVEKGRGAQAIAIMFTGMTVANLLGVPLGTYIGHEFSWRYTYIMISSLGLITMLAIYYWLPIIESDTDAHILEQLNYFKTKTAWILILMISFGTGGLFAWMSYIAPLATNVSHIQAEKVPFIMTLVGLGMVIGNLAGGKLSDAIGAERAVLISFSAMATCLIVIFFTSSSPVMSYVMAFVTGAVAFSCSPSIQMLLISSAKGAETLAAAAGQASFNLGNTLGAFLGGLPMTYGLTFDYPALVGVGMSFIGATFIIVYMRVHKQQNTVNNPPIESPVSPL